jgi:battenin
MFRLGVFISRASIRFVQIKWLYLFVVFQMLNVAILLSQVLIGWMPGIWLVFLIIFWEGLLGGGCYVNA